MVLDQAWPSFKTANYISSFNDEARQTLYPFAAAPPPLVHFTTPLTPPSNQQYDYSLSVPKTLKSKKITAVSLFKTSMILQS